MDEASPPNKKSRTLLLAGATVGIGVAVCGLGSVVLAGAGWYLYQPVSIDFETTAWKLEDSAPRPLPVPRLHRHIGEPEPAPAPITWTVDPPELGTTTGGQFNPSERGKGTLKACAEEICGTLPIELDLADAITVEPAKAEARVWTPRQLNAAAMWSREAVPVPLTYTSSDPKVVTVDASGLATPTGPGSANILIRGGGATATVPFRVYPQPPAHCTLASYADALGRKGTRSEQKECLPHSPDLCEWTATQQLVDRGRIDEGGGPQWRWTTLWLPATDLEQIWAAAQLCMELPPEVAALDIPALVTDSQGGTRSVQLAGEWAIEPANATVSYRPGTVTVDLPTTCGATREFTVEKYWIKLGVAGGC